MITILSALVSLLSFRVRSRVYPALAGPARRGPGGSTGDPIAKPKLLTFSRESADSRWDGCAVAGLFRSRAALQAEVLMLRHQLNVQQRKAPKRFAFGAIDRLVFAGLYLLAPGVLDALKILKPETGIRWHRAGFRAYWRWKSRPPGGRPTIPTDIRQLIREMSVANPLWGAPRIHGELLKLGINVS